MPLPPQGGQPPGLFGQRQPMAQVGGRAPGGQPTPGGQSGMPQQGPRPPMDPMQAKRMIDAREMMLKSELLKIRALKSMMPQAPKGKKSGA